MDKLSIEETKEIWKQIEEEDFNSYSVSNLGRIKNRRGKILKPQLICGYLYCILRRKNGKNTSRRINRLVALAFCDGYKDGYVANHIDHDRLNNRADNLEWCTQKEEAPESVYLALNVFGDVIKDQWQFHRLRDDDIEYTRTDAFIEKAAEWLHIFMQTHLVTEVLTGKHCEKELIEEFYKYMKGE